MAIYALKLKQELATQLLTYPHNFNLKPFQVSNTVIAKNVSRPIELALGLPDASGFYFQHITYL